MDFTSEAKIAWFKEQLSEDNPEAMLYDECDRALIGVGGQAPGQLVAIYSYTLLIRHFTDVFAKDHEGEEEYDAYEAACDWVGNNVECSCVGEHTPIIVQDWGLEEVEG